MANWLHKHAEVVAGGGAGFDLCERTDSRMEEKRRELIDSRSSFEPVSDFEAGKLLNIGDILGSANGIRMG
jgi:hypothetical protein